jgi:NTP pyrophosphatase (non-canonical NTP hydrolase)
MKYEEEVQNLLTDNSLLHLISGLAAETGEVCGLIQKASYQFTEISREDMLIELGDTLFYLTALSNHFRFTEQEIKDANVKKLRERHGK